MDPDTGHTFEWEEEKEKVLQYDQERYMRMMEDPESAKKQREYRAQRRQTEEFQNPEPRKNRKEYLREWRKRQKLAK